MAFGIIYLCGVWLSNLPDYSIDPDSIEIINDFGDDEFYDKLQKIYNNNKIDNDDWTDTFFFNTLLFVWNIYVYFAIFLALKNTIW